MIETVSGQSWVAEGADIPDVALTTGAEIVAVQKLAGIVMINAETIEYAGFDVQLVG